MTKTTLDNVTDEMRIEKAIACLGRKEYLSAQELITTVIGDSENARRMRASFETIKKLKIELLESRLFAEDAKNYLIELKHCANTNNQHAIIDEALRLLP